MKIRKALAVAGLAVAGLTLTGCGATEYQVIGEYTIPEHVDGDETDLEQPVLVVFANTDPSSVDVSWDCFEKFEKGDTISASALRDCQIEYED